MRGGLSASATKATIAHGNANSRLHEVHQAEQKERRKNAKVRALYEVVAPEDEPEMFKSNLLGLVPEGLKGRTFWRGGGVGDLVELEGGDWEAKLGAELERLKVWHERREKDGKESYHKHTLKDSDLKRKTYETRPDHSRALEYLAAEKPASLVAEVLSSIRAEKIRLFEEIYRRKVSALGEHCDSGHYHNDIWSYSSEEKKVGDRTIIERGTFFREYGVGPGAARWDRHLRVLSELKMDTGVTGAVPRLLAADEKWALEQNKEPARDLRFMRALDSYVEKTLREVDAAAVDRAKREYGEFLADGYAKGELGVEKMLDRKEQMAALEEENKSLKRAVAMAVEFLQALVRLPAFEGLLKTSPLLEKLFHGLLAALGLGVKEPVKAPRVERLKTMAMKLERVMEDMGPPSMTMGKGKRRKKDTPSLPKF